MKSPKKAVVPGDIENGRYPKKEDAIMRLDKSVFLYGSNPVYGVVDDECQSDEIKVKPLPEGNGGTQTVKYNDDLINFNHRDPGFFEQGSTILYVSRVPARKQKQGFNSDSIVSKVFKTDTGKFVQFTLSTGYLFEPGFAKAFLGEYRPVSESFEIHKSSERPVAVSNRLALAAGKVFFDLDCIGDVTKDSKAPCITLNSSYLDSVLVMHLSNLGIDTTNG